MVYHGSLLDLILFHIFLNELDGGAVCPQQAYRQNRIGGSGGYTRMCCHPEGPQQAGSVRASCRSARGRAKSCTWAGTAPGTWTCWGHPDGKQLCRKGPGGPGGHQDEH